jgi:serine acetyltransferase
MTRDIIDLKTLREYLAADLEANFFNRRSCAYRYLKWHRICRYFYLKRGALPKLLLKLANLRRRHYGDRYGFDFKIASPMGKGYHISHNIGVINMARSCGDGLIFRNFVVIGVKVPFNREFALCDTDAIRDGRLIDVHDLCRVLSVSGDRDKVLLLYFQ